jgi:hypothetical protein
MNIDDSRLIARFQRLITEILVEKRLGQRRPELTDEVYQTWRDQIAVLAIQFVGHIAAYSAEPAVIKAADIELLTVCERDNFCRLIYPEAKILFNAR